MNRRSYQQNCTLAFALDLMGDRWTWLIVRDLLAGPRKFSILCKNLEGIGTNLLSARLKDLTEAGVVERVDLPFPLSGKAWQLTEIGRELEGVVVQLARWGWRHLAGSYKETNHWSPLWNYVACQARFDPQQCPSLQVIGALNIGGYQHWLKVDAGTFSFGEGARDDADFTLTCDSDVFARLAFGNDQDGQGIENYVEGNIKKFADCMKCFS